MTTNRQAYALDQLEKEIDDHAPHRDKRSDGGIGDARHQATKSDHNPNAAHVWRAHDFTNQPGDGLNVPELATLLARKLGKHPALMSGAYIIYSRRIISFDRLAEGWRPYTGINAHKTHIHVSVSTAAAGYDSREPWNLWTNRITTARRLLTEAAGIRTGPDRAAILRALAILPKD